MWRTGLEGMLITARQAATTSENDMKRSMGFTLVELLVVIAIIALLISILAPSLKTAKDLTRQMICGTYLRSIAMATILYAEGDGGKLPKIAGMLHTPALGEPYDWDNGANAPVLMNDGSGRNTPYGMGYLHFAGLVAPDMLYCPLYATVPDPDPRWLRSSYPDPYSLVRIPYDQIHTVNFFAGYLWNVNITLRGDGRADTTYNKLERLPGSAFMAMDLYLRRWDIGHWLAGPTTPSWQVAMPAGNVQLKQSQQGYAYMQQADMYNNLTDFQKGLEYLQGKL
jgi:prepilin-type N-terminal cleavage/methylation domain-containing protein